MLIVDGEKIGDKLSTMADDREKIWRGVMEALKLSVSTASFNTYLRHLELVNLEPSGDRLIGEVNCPSPFLKQTVEQRFWGQIAQELERITGKKCEVKFISDSRKIEEWKKEDAPLFEEEKKKTGDWRRANLREDYTFDNYAVGGSNQMAYAAAQAVAKRPGTAYNPLFIYGGVGVGKTHLMQAIGHVIVAGNENRVLFCSGEEFTNDLVEAIRLKSTEKVRSKYRKLKLLMIDDVQFIAGKATVQEEFFHTFNALQKEGGQVIMTSDRPPAEITKLEDRLKSRFGAGLIVDVGQPDFELRTAILLIKSKQLGLNLEMDLAQLIAAQIEGVRELQGFLVKIMSEKEGAGREINRENLEKLLNVSRGQNGRSKVVTPTEVMTLVGEYYRVTAQQLKGERRTKMVAWPRQILMYLLRNELRLPFEEVGRLVGGRDHSTVMHADSKIKVEMEVNPKITAEIQEIKKKMLL